MGRMSRYKKVKSIDPFAKNGSWKSDVGDCATLNRKRRKSKTALKMKEQKMNKLQRRMRGRRKDGAGKSGGSNGWADDDGFDLPPEGGDEFDLSDLMGSVKRQKNKANHMLLLDIPSPARETVLPSVGGAEKYPRKGERVNPQGISGKDRAPTSKNHQKSNASSSKVKAENDRVLNITAKTPTREIIAAYTNPKSGKQKKKKNDEDDSSGGLSKQEKRKAFLAKKKLKKRKGSNGALLYDEDNEDYAKLQVLQWSQSHSSSSTQQKQPKKHSVKQHNYSDTMIARTPAIDDQVERPPTFSSLPRGANRLSKNKKAKQSSIDGGSLKEEDDTAKAQRIRKEQRALESMRENVMKRYALLRESRRNGG